MKIKYKKENNILYLYRDHFSVFLFQFFMGILCICLGAFMKFYISVQPNASAFQWFGYLFMFAGIVVLFSLPGRIKRSKNQKIGDIVSVFTKEELTLSQGIGADQYTYKWDEIQKINLCERLIYNRKNKRFNCLVVFFKEHVNQYDLIERTKRGISNNTTGDYFFIIDLPKSIHLYSLSSDILSVNDNIEVSIVKDLDISLN